jgi:hypothetical protein
MLRFYIGNGAKDIEAILDTVADAYRPPIYTLSRTWERHRIGLGDLALARRCRT